MSDLMLYGVLEMPVDLAMGDEISRIQFHARVQEAVKRLKAAEAEVKAWRERFPQHYYRPQDDCVALKL